MEENRTQPEVPDRERSLWIAAALLCLLALGDSLWLYIVQTDYEGFAATCKLAEGFDCAPALKSRFGRLFGISLSSYAITTYTLFMALTIQALIKTESSTRNAYLLMLFSGVGTVFCVWLAYVSKFKLKAYCPYCLVLHILTPLIFMVTLSLAIRYKSGLPAMIKEEWRTIKEDKWIAGGIVSAFLLLVIGLPTYQYFQKEKVLEKNPHYRKILDGTWNRLPQDIEEKLLKGKPFRGSADAAVTIIEFGDFTCPVCQAFSHRIHDLMEVYDIKYYFVDYPRSSECNPAATTNRGGSCHGALLAKYAEKTGKFWDVHDALFDDVENLGATSDTFMAQLAGAPDMNAIGSDTESRLGVLSDVNIANALGVRQTPTIIINGMGVEGVPANWFLLEAIENELARVRNRHAQN